MARTLRSGWNVGSFLCLINFGKTILDSATFPHVRDARYMDPNALKLAQLIGTLIDKAGKQAITVSRGGEQRSCDATKHKRGGGNSQMVSELRQDLQRWLNECSEFQGGDEEDSFWQVWTLSDFYASITPTLSNHWTDKRSYFHWFMVKERKTTLLNPNVHVNSSSIEMITSRNH